MERHYGCDDWLGTARHQSRIDRHPYASRHGGPAIVDRRLPNALVRWLMTLADRASVGATRTQMVRIVAPLDMSAIAAACRLHAGDAFDLLDACPDLSWTRC